MSGRFGVPAIQMGVDVPRLPHFERGIEDIRPECRRLPVGRHGVVEPVLGIEDIAEGKAGLGVFRLDGEHLAEALLRPVEIALRVTDEPDAKHGAGMAGAERGGPSQGFGSAVEVSLDPKCLGRD